MTATPPASGTVTGNGTFLAGTSQTVTATANPGYTFVNWTESGDVVSTSASFTFALNANRTLVANFTAIQGNTFTISVNASPSIGGTVGGGGTFLAGTSQTVTATANTGYTFVNWTESGGVVSTSASFTFPVNANHTLIANFTAVPGNFTVAVSASPSIGGTVDGGGSFPAGSSQTVTANANPGYTGVGALTSDWHIAGTGDFDGDGKSDILLRHDSGFVAIWEMNGEKIKAALCVGTLTNDWHIAGTADLDGDGKNNVLLRHDSGFVAVWEMNGEKIKAARGVGTLANDWHIAGTGDFDSDGKSDILLRHDRGFVATWEMNGEKIKAALGVGSLTTDWHIAGTADFDGDGMEDILLRHDSGFVAVWEMNGEKIKAVLGVGTLTNDWHIQ